MLQQNDRFHEQIYTRDPSQKTVTEDRQSILSLNILQKKSKAKLKLKEHVTKGDKFNKEIKIFNDKILCLSSVTVFCDGSRV